MKKDFVKRFKTKDGRIRISIYRDDYAENPRDWTDEPLHCEDWSRDYSIMTKDERESKSSSARELLERMIIHHTDWKKVIDYLVDNGKHMTDGYCKSNDALVYNKSEHRWDLMSDMLHYNSETRKNEMGWCLNNHYYEKKYNIDLYGLLEDVCDSTIDYLAQNFLGDKVKIMSYGFGYYGDISFYREFSTDSEGIAWIEKDEFLKYSGNGKGYWKDNDCYDIEKWLVEELEAWGNGDVYGFVVEDCIKSKIHKEYTNVDKEDEDYEEEEWENTDSCGGFYGDLDKCTEWIVEQAGFKMEELEEVEE